MGGEGISDRMHPQLAATVANTNFLPKRVWFAKTRWAPILNRVLVPLHGVRPVALSHNYVEFRP